VGSADAGPTPGRSGQGGHGADASDEPGGFDEYDISRLFDEPAPPETGQEAKPEPTAEATDEPSDDVNTEAQNDDTHPDTRRAEEHLADLKRLQAEYVNYKRRVDRDRDVAKEQGVTQVVEALLPVLDDIHLAREHGDLDGGPFAAIADKLEGVLRRFGITRLGEKGEEFDPSVHEALMHVEADLDEDATVTTVVQVLQPGYRIGERVVRPARVSVADPK
jgi:molecular chaperone GrpE